MSWLLWGEDGVRKESGVNTTRFYINYCMFNSVITRLGHVFLFMCLNPVNRLYSMPDCHLLHERCSHRSSVGDYLQNENLSCPSLPGSGPIVDHPIGRREDNIRCTHHESRRIRFASPHCLSLFFTISCATFDTVQIS